MNIFSVYRQPSSYSKRHVMLMSLYRHARVRWRAFAATAIGEWHVWHQHGADKQTAGAIRYHTSSFSLRWPHSSRHRLVGFAKVSFDLRTKYWGRRQLIVGYVGNVGRRSLRTSGLKMWLLFITTGGFPQLSISSNSQSECDPTRPHLPVTGSCLLLVKTCKSTVDKKVGIFG